MDTDSDRDIENQVTLDIIELQQKRDKVIALGIPEYMIDIYEQVIVYKVSELKL